MSKEVQPISKHEDILDFEEQEKISKYDEDTKAGRNQNKTNPYKSVSYQMKSDGDDQVQMQQSYKPDYEGFAPFHANRMQRKKALWDAPPAQSPDSGTTGSPMQAPFSSAGEIPDPNVIKPKRWEDTWDKTRSQKKYKRENNDSLVVEDQTHLDEAGG